MASKSLAAISTRYVGSLGYLDNPKSGNSKHRSPPKSPSGRRRARIYRELCDISNTPQTGRARFSQQHAHIHVEEVKPFWQQTSEELDRFWERGVGGGTSCRRSRNCLFALFVPHVRRKRWVVSNRITINLQLGTGSRTTFAKPGGFFLRKERRDSSRHMPS